MIFTWLLQKLKGLFLLFVNLFRKALCCIRKRRHSFSDTVPLTHVVSNVDQENDLQKWTNWDDSCSTINKPKTVQDYIDQYRHQTVETTTTENNEDYLNLFENMSPKITKQTKILVKTKSNQNNNTNLTNRLGVLEDSVNVISSSELAEWDENNGWEGELLLDREAQKILREQKRLERERKASQQHQKRLEKASKVLGSKLVT